MFSSATLWETVRALVSIPKQATNTQATAKNKQTNPWDLILSTTINERNMKREHAVGSGRQNHSLDH